VVAGFRASLVQPLLDPLETCHNRIGFLPEPLDLCLRDHRSCIETALPLETPVSFAADAGQGGLKRVR